MPPPITPNQRCVRDVGFLASVYVPAALLFAAWATHVGWMIGKVGGNTTWQFLVGLVGTAFPPLGIIHGVMIWFGRGL